MVLPHSVVLPSKIELTDGLALAAGLANAARPQPHYLSGPLMGDLPEQYKAAADAQSQANQAGPGPGAEAMMAQAQMEHAGAHGSALQAPSLPSHFAQQVHPTPEKSVLSGILSDEKVFCSIMP